MSVKLGVQQSRIYAAASTGVAYTVDQLEEFAKEFSSSATLKTPGSLINPDSFVHYIVQGLCEYTYFAPAIAIGGDVTDIDDWRFWKVASPTVTADPVVTTYQIPYRHGYSNETAVAPAGY